MPYIGKSLREKINRDYRLSQLAEHLLSLPEMHFAGALNYVIHYLVKKRLQREGINYFRLNNIVGSIECAKREIQRRFVDCYEQDKIVENGDIDIS